MTWLEKENLALEAHRAAHQAVPARPRPEPLEVRLDRIEVYKAELAKRGFTEREINSSVQATFGLDGIASTGTLWGADDDGDIWVMVPGYGIQTGDFAAKLATVLFGKGVKG